MRDSYIFGKTNAREVDFIFSCPFRLPGKVLFKDPQRNLRAFMRQEISKRRPPASGTNYSDLAHLSAFPLFSIFAHVSRNDTVLLNTRLSAFESGSTQK